MIRYVPCPASAFIWKQDRIGHSTYIYIFIHMKNFKWKSGRFKGFTAVTIETWKRRRYGSRCWLSLKILSYSFWWCMKKRELCALSDWLCMVNNRQCFKALCKQIKLKYQKMHPGEIIIINIIIIIIILIITFFSYLKF